MPLFTPVPFLTKHLTDDSTPFTAFSGLGVVVGGSGGGGGGGNGGVDIGYGRFASFSVLMLRSLHDDTRDVLRL